VDFRAGGLFTLLKPLLSALLRSISPTHVYHLAADLYLIRPDANANAQHSRGRRIDP
jgi:hypothetical protein